MPLKSFFLLLLPSVRQKMLDSIIRGRHKWSLSLHLCMSSREYSTLLLGCDFVEVRRDGVRLKDEFQQFVKRYINDDAPSTRESKCEFSPSNGIYIDALRDGAKSIDRKKSAILDMAMLRVGSYGNEGETVNPTLQINDCTDPPEFDPRLRSGHRRLTNAIRPSLRELYLRDKVDAVMKWVEMRDIFGDEDDTDEDDTDDEEKKMPVKPSPPTPANIQLYKPRTAVRKRERVHMILLQCYYNQFKRYKM